MAEGRVGVPLSPYYMGPDNANVRVPSIRVFHDRRQQSYTLAYNVLLYVVVVSECQVTETPNVVLRLML